MRTRDTIFALSSGRPPAAIAIIRVSGPSAHEAARGIAGSLAPARVAALRSLRHPRSGELLDQALVVRFDGPASATGEDLVEFHCHGGRAVVEGIMAAMREGGGLREANPGEFTRRAFHNGRIDLTEAEGLADLLEAETQSQRRAALIMAEGGLRKQIDRWRDHLLLLSVAAERAIDYDDDDLAFDTSLSKDSSWLVCEIEQYLERPRIEPLKDGVLVVVGGPPNAGKSSLINAIAGVEKAIVTAVPGTTRDSIEVPISIGGVPVRLIDTAGIRETHDEVEAIGVQRAGQLIEAADVLVWLGGNADAPHHPRRILVHSKADLASSGPAPVGSLPVSSVTFDGLSLLLERVEILARSVLPAEDGVALNRRQASLLHEVRNALESAASSPDLLLVAENLRLARSAIDRLTGRAGLEDLLDSLFRRFCLGK